MIRGSQRYLLGVVLLVALTLLVYAPALRAGYVWDDDDHVFPEATQDGLDGLWRIWTEPGATIQYYPLVFTLFWAENHLWGIDHPLGYHLTNVLLHALAALLLWRALAILDFGASTAWAAALVFAVHPVHVESVAWITEHKNTLSTVFYLAAFLAYLRFADADGPAAKRDRRWYAAALVLFVAALLSKTATVTFPAAVLVVLWWRQRPLRRELVPLLPFFGVAVAMGVVTLWVERTQLRTYGADWDLTILQRLLLAGRVPWFYASKLLAPLDLAFIYPRWEIDPLVPWQYVFPVATLGTVVVLWLLRSRIGRGPLAAVLLFIGTLAPVLGFLNAYFFRFSWVADHVVYLATPALIALVVGAVSHGLSRRSGGWRTVGRVAGAAAILCLAVLSWRQAAIYRDYETLWRDTLRKNPEAWIAHNNLGLAAGERGETEPAAKLFAEAKRLKPDDPVIRMNLGRSLSLLGRFDEAERELTRALELGPDFSVVHVNYAEHLERTGRPEQATSSYRSALRLRDDAPTHSQLAVALARLGRRDEAERHFRDAIELDAESADAHLGLAVMLRSAGDVEQALMHFSAAVELDPKNSGAQHLLGRTLLTLGDGERAMLHLRRAVELDPEEPRHLTSLAWALSTDVDATRRDGATAVSLALRAVQVTGGQDPAALDALAAAQAEVGRFDEAIRTALAARDRAQAGRRSELAAAIGKRLDSYRAGRPHRSDPTRPVAASRESDPLGPE